MKNTRIIDPGNQQVAATDSKGTDRLLVQVFSELKPIANSIGEILLGPLQDGYSRVWHGGTSCRQFVRRERVTARSPGDMLNGPWPSPHIANSSGGSSLPPTELAGG